VEIIKGIGKIQEMSERIRQEASKDAIKYLRLKKSKDVAIFRFLTDGDSIISAQFHKVAEQLSNGTTIHTTKYCPEQDGQPCKWHAQGLTTSELIFAWVYWKNYLHTTQNPALETNPDAQRWTPGSFNGITMYKETVEAPALFSTSVGQKGSYKKALINYYNRYGTFLDRDYEYIRDGIGMDTLYTLMPRDPSTVSEDVASLLSTLPDLSLVVSGKITSLSQKEPTTSEETEEVQEEPAKEETEEVF
jgi:hypothetical protein